MGANYISELTVSFLRPMARRREITARPSAVFMRVRKPWVFARRRLFGWKVRLGILVSYDGGLENSSVQHGAAFLIRDGYPLKRRHFGERFDQVTLGRVRSPPPDKRANYGNRRRSNMNGPGSCVTIRRNSGGLGFSRKLYSPSTIAG